MKKLWISHFKKKEVDVSTWPPVIIYNSYSLTWTLSVAITYFEKENKKPLVSQEFWTWVKYVPFLIIFLYILSFVVGWQLNFLLNSCLCFPQPYEAFWDQKYMHGKIKFILIEINGLFQQNNVNGNVCVLLSSFLIISFEILLYFHEMKNIFLFVSPYNFLYWVVSSCECV